MAEIVASLLGPTMEELGKSIVAPIKRQFNYLCCFNSNIQSLKDEAEKLNDAKIGLQMQVEAAENNAEVIVPEVKTWLANASTKIQVDVSGIEIEIPNVKSRFLGIKSRFLLSRKAKKITEAMKQLLQDRCTFNHISQPAPAPASVSLPLGQTYEFQSRKWIEEEIMGALRGKNVNVVGICGMGGVGKTTMAKRITNRVKEENLFDEVVIVVVSQQVDMMKIQSEIAESLGMKLEERTLPARANKLHARLTASKKRILMVLDDVWEKLKYEELGIPCEIDDVYECVILLTSRNRDVLKKMNAQKICAVEILSEKEAWFLFREKVGSCADDLNLLSVAEQVAKECKGLPVALLSVGEALRDQHIKPIWEDALQQLKSSNPMDIPDFIAEVYNPLKLSYNFLKNRNAKSFFLLCSLFPEDFDMNLESLTLYCVGLRLLEGIRSVEQARNRVLTIVEMLKSRSLLLDGSNMHHVKMHDVVRDVAIVIASEEGLVDVNLQTKNWPRGGRHSYNECKWVLAFLEKDGELPNYTRLNFPSLRLFAVLTKYFREFQIEDFSLFDGMTNLNVLSLEHVSLKSPPQPIHLLGHLRTLNLVGCGLENIFFVGELTSLEILRCIYCHEIRELPVEIGRLNRLKLLEFSFCARLKTMARGIISNLIELEELKMLDSFKGWEFEGEDGGEKGNATLNELESLSNLSWLEIEIEDYTLAAKELRFSSKILKHHIQTHKRGLQYRDPSQRTMILILPREITLGSWIYMFLSTTEDLYLQGDGSNSLDLLQAQNTKTLMFNACSVVKNLANTTTLRRFSLFLMLECLRLFHLPNLEEICVGPIQEGSNSFKNLKKIILRNLPALNHLWGPNQIVSLSNLSIVYIADCCKLCNVFVCRTGNDGGFSQLESVKIVSCEIMEQVIFSSNGESQRGGDRCRVITFPKLKSVTLDSLRSLTTFCKGIESIEFPSLTKMSISYCPKIISFVHAIGNNQSSGDEGQNQSSGDEGHDDDSLHLFCRPKVTFGSLKQLSIRGYNTIKNMWCRQIPIDFFTRIGQLTISNCDNIKSLFSSSIAANLVNLKQLKIQRCLEMEKVIEDMNDERLSEKYQLFPNVKWLSLADLPKMASFCHWSCDLELPLLKKVSIVNCPLMQNFTTGFPRTPKLKNFSRDYNRLKNVKDMNADLRFQLKEESTSTQGSEEEVEQEESEIAEEEVHYEEGDMDEGMLGMLAQIPK